MSLKESMESLGMKYNPELAKFNKASEELAKIFGMQEKYEREKLKFKSPLKIEVAWPD